MSELHEHLQSLDASLAALERDGLLHPDDPSSKDIIHAQMAEVLALPGGGDALVARYGGDARIAVVRPLAFLLGVTVNDAGRAHDLAAAVFAMIETIRIDDPWPRLNLLTAVQRLMIFGALGAVTTPSSSLGTLLRASLDELPALRATAAAVVGDLFYRGHTSLVPADDLAILRTKVLDLAEDQDELTRAESRNLREYLTELQSASGLS